MNEDIGAAIIWLDEAEAFVRVEEFYSASLGHQQVLFSLSVFSGGQHHDVAQRAVAGSFKKGSLFTAETCRNGFEIRPQIYRPKF
ncbi:hypothetical protein [Neorhizobium lilium]|uniref:hypothetical protein n=1 Tax=Neorhizobium lilium TaxID=2503024 RepID=UPI0013E3E564|nr:hypothetical protein [Neorhizobium lilium]